MTQIWALGGYEGNLGRMISDAQVANSTLRERLGKDLRECHVRLDEVTIEVAPGRLLDAGFHFEFPHWANAAADLAN